MTLPIIFPGDEITLLYRENAVDGDPRIDCYVVEVHWQGYDVQRADDPNGEIWTAFLSEEAEGLFRIVDHRPARQRALTEEDVR